MAKLLIRLAMASAAVMALVLFLWPDADDLAPAIPRATPQSQAQETLPATSDAGKLRTAMVPAPSEQTPPRFSLRYETETAPERLRPPPMPVQSPVNEAQRFYRVIVEGADMLKADDTTIRLAGLDAPDPGETCTAAQGEPWPCGRIGQAALARLIRARAVECRFDGRDADGALLGRCTVAGTDINEWVVRRGWARTGEESAYQEALAAAKEEGTGLWGTGERSP